MISELERIFASIFNCFFLVFTSGPLRYIYGLAEMNIILIFRSFTSFLGLLSDTVSSFFLFFIYDIAVK